MSDLLSPVYTTLFTCPVQGGHSSRKLQATIKKSLRTVLRQAGLKGVTLHTLRHTFASQLCMAGVSLREVKELLGHASFETTLQYAHLSQDHVKKQVLRLPFAGD
ncbi:MAG: tyrosine-type recombinase/integrase [Candidatus Thorarchaeota archaeon]